MNGQSDIVFEIKPQKVFSLGVRELVEYRELFYFLSWRDIKVKYKETVLGFFWVILQPVIFTLIFSMFLGKSFRQESVGMSYPVFVSSGLMVWLLFSSGLTNAGNSMITNAAIIKKIYFPRLIIPITSILVSVFDFFIMFMLFLVLLFIYPTTIDGMQALMFWPTALLLTVIGTFGPGCLLAALNIKYRDFRYVIPFLVQALLFLTPVIYPADILGSTWRKYLLAFNPMYAPISLFRMPITTAPLDTTLLCISIGSSLILFVIGLLYFKSTERYFADLA